MLRSISLLLLLNISFSFHISPFHSLQPKLHNLKLSISSASSISPDQYALLFDCDGVIVETEELHRIAYNAAFEKFGLILLDGKPVIWDNKYYDILQNTVGGGKPKMNHYFNKDAKAWPICTKPYKRAPQTDEEKKRLVDLLQDTKTDFYTKIIEDMATAREGVLELMDEAIADKSLKVFSFILFSYFLFL
jgi:hypothetical protein